MSLPDELVWGTIAELGAALRARRVTAVALAQAYLERLERFGNALGAVVTTMPERALEDADAADRDLARGRVRGPLHGIPYGAKDLVAARGAPTTWGAVPYRDQHFDEDATVIERLGAAGAVLVAKLAMVELAGGLGYAQANASFTGPGRNPWDPTRWSGGSSTGPGAAVAAGLVPFAIASETWGSIICPAAFCGVTGLRPSFGRVSRHGAMALSWTMDKLGPIARSAEDCATVLAAIAGPDPRDPHATAGAFTPSRDRRRRPTVGVLSGCTSGAQLEVAANFRRSVELLRQVADVVDDVVLPDLPYEDAAGLIVDAEAASAFEGLLEAGGTAHLTAADDRIGGYPGLAILARDYLRALRLRGVAALALDEALGRFDAIVAPAQPTVAPPVADRFEVDDLPSQAGEGRPPLSAAANLVGLPSVTVPNGFGVGGLPTGLELTGRMLGESPLLAIAAELQARTDWHRRRPPGA